MSDKNSEFNLTEEEIHEQIERKSDTAKELLEDSDKMECFLEQLERKLSKIPKAGEYIASIPILISLVRSYIKKEYTAIPWGSIIAIVAALVYFVSILDLIPDSIPVAGYLDDAAVLAIAIRMVKDDLDDYVKWRKKNNKQILYEEENDEPNCKEET